MQRLRPRPVESLENLRNRIERLFGSRESRQHAYRHAELDVFPRDPERAIVHPSKSIVEFLNFLADAVPDGDVYLFGGVLRDVALCGRRGFASDIDLVVEGNWNHCVQYLVALGAEQNK